MKAKKFLLIAVITTLLFTAGTINSSGSRLKDISKKINSTESTLNKDKKKIAEIDKVMQSLKVQIEKTEGDIIKLKADILSIGEEIKDVDKKLKVSEKDLADMRDDLSKRLRNMYKSGNIGFVDVILTSEDVDELLSNAELVKKIYSGDRDMVEKIKKEYDNIKDSKDRLSKLRTGLKEKEEEMGNKKQAIKNTLRDYAGKKGTLSAKNVKTKNLLASLHEDRNDILNSASSQGGNSASEIHYSRGRYSKGNMAWPCGGRGDVVCGFGPRICPFHGYEIHSGIDIALPYGTEVVAAKSGVVSLSGWNGGFGKCVKIYHGGGISTLYGHNSSLLVHQGQRVKKGQVIARVGSTGASTGPHCHFSVIKNGSFVNPMNYLK